MLTAEKRHQVLLDKLLREADEYVTANEPKSGSASTKKQLIVAAPSMDDKVADGVVTVLWEVLAEISREPTHPLRLKLEKAVKGRDLSKEPCFPGQVKRRLVITYR